MSDPDKVGHELKVLNSMVAKVQATWRGHKQRKKEALAKARKGKLGEIGNVTEHMKSGAVKLTTEETERKSK